MKFIVIVLTLIGGIMGLSAQNLTAPKSLRVVMAVLPNDQTMNPGDTAFKANTQLSAKAFVSLHDTTGIQKIHFKMGSSDGGSNYRNKTFVFDQSGVLADGTSYSRHKKTVVLGLGNLTGVNLYYAEVWLEDANGNISTKVKANNLKH